MHGGVRASPCQRKLAGRATRLQAAVIVVRVIRLTILGLVLYPIRQIRSQTYSRVHTFV